MAQSYWLAAIKTLSRGISEFVVKPLAILLYISLIAGDKVFEPIIDFNLKISAEGIETALEQYVYAGRTTSLRLEKSAGALTNFEVLDLLRSRGAAKDSSRVMAFVSPSEYKVFDYLEETAACNQTRDIIHKFVDECKKFDLAKAEILNVVNIRPSSAVEVYTIVEECESRLDEKNDEFVETITRILPPHPLQKEESNQETDEGKEEDAAE